MDVSPEAIDRRLRDLAQLHRLGMSLRAGHWVEGAPDAEEPRKAD